MNSSSNLADHLFRRFSPPSVRKLGCRNSNLTMIWIVVNIRRDSSVHVSDFSLHKLYTSCTESDLLAAVKALVTSPEIYEASLFSPTHSLIAVRSS